MSCELSARLTIHKKCPALFSLNNFFRMPSAAVVIGALRTLLNSVLFPGLQYFRSGMFLHTTGALFLKQNL